MPRKNALHGEFNASNIKKGLGGIKMWEQKIEMAT